MSVGAHDLRGSTERLPKSRATGFSRAEACRMYRVEERLQIHLGDGIPG